MEQDKDKLLNKQSFDLDTNISATIIHKKIPLHLRSSFGTSHSSTTIRYNSFIQIILNDENSHKSFYGLGESGLPPKKPGCYLADYNDISSYINDYFTFLNSIILNKNGELNEKIFEEYITDLNKIIKKDTTLPKYIYILFYSMDNCPANKYEYSNAAKNCLEGVYGTYVEKY